MPWKELLSYSSHEKGAGHATWGHVGKAPGLGTRNSICEVKVRQAKAQGWLVSALPEGSGAEAASSCQVLGPAQT